MNTQMGSALPSEKLDRTNFASWEYKMHQYLVGQGYWSYIEGVHTDQPIETAPEYAEDEETRATPGAELASGILSSEQKKIRRELLQ